MRAERRLLKEHVGYSVDSIDAAIRLILRTYFYYYRWIPYAVIAEFNKNWCAILNLYHYLVH